MIDLVNSAQFAVRSGEMAIYVGRSSLPNGYAYVDADGIWHSRRPNESEYTGRFASIEAMYEGLRLGVTRLRCECGAALSSQADLASDTCSACRSQVTP